MQGKHFSYCTRVFCCAIFLFALPEFSRAVAPPFSSSILPAAERIYTRLLHTIPHHRYPITTQVGAWKTTDASGWTSGFFPGSLWLLFELRRTPSLKQAALSRQAGLTSQQENTATHDIGFMLFSSFGNGYRLTGNPAHKAVLLKGAASLATRYSPVVHALRSWNGPRTRYDVIIDSMMNLQLLFWASSHGGSSTLRTIAIEHAKTIQRDFFRPNGTVYQLVTYDPTYGRILGKSNPQGYSPTSVWSRGQAWALYGFTTLYKETQDVSFLTTAERAADAFLRLLPSDGIPFWDATAPRTSASPKDSSAAAIAASGLLQLSHVEPHKEKKAVYRQAGLRLLSLLSRSPYFSGNGPSLLLHGTYNKNIGDADSGTSWGDYYFLEAIRESR